MVANAACVYNEAGQTSTTRNALRNTEKTERKAPQNANGGSRRENVFRAQMKTISPQDGGVEM